MMRQIEWQRPWLADYQIAALFCPERYGLIEASTKSGKTVGALVWLTERACEGKTGQNFWWVAPIYKQAEIAYARLKQMIPHALFVYNDSKLTIGLVNGTTIWFKGADNPDSLFGEDVYAAVIDEASRCKADAWYAVRSTITATGGPVRMIGNVKGRKNWHYEFCRQAEQGAVDTHYAKIDAHDAVKAGIIPAAEVEDARRRLPANVFRELYLAIPSDDGGNPFDMAAIEKCTLPEDTYSKEPVVSWGWDLAKSTDWTVGIGLDEQGRVAAFHRWQGPWELTIAKVTGLVGAAALIDATGVGDPIFERLQRAKPEHMFAFKFTSTSKQQIMEGLAAAIQSREILFPAGPISDELKTFEYEHTRTGVRYTAPAGLHDDCVCALALAVHQWGHKPVKLNFIVGIADAESLEERERREAEEYAARQLEAKATVDEAIKLNGAYFPGGR